MSIYIGVILIASLIYCRGFCSWEILHMFIYRGRYCISYRVSPLVFVQSHYLLHRLWTTSFVKHFILNNLYIPSNRPDTFEQVEVPLDIFGKASVYLKGWSSTMMNICSLARNPLHGMTCSIIANVSVWYIFYCVFDRGNESSVAAVWWKSFSCISA